MSIGPWDHSRTSADPRGGRRWSPTQPGESVNTPGRHRAWPSAARRMTAFAGITLIGVGAILLDVHVVGVVLILAGVLCLLLSPLVGASGGESGSRFTS